MVNKFWPISLLNAAFKIISKVLANRIRPHIHLLVDQIQSAFTKNGYIVDSVACAQKILAASHNFNLEAISFKLDFEKVFVSISWDFLFELLSTRGFGQRWVRWIKDYLIFWTSSNLVNGKSCNYIQLRRGLRKGDPLSPYLFILLVDTLTRIFSLAEKNGSIQKVGSFPWPNNLVSLHYSDNTPFLVPGDDRSLI